MNTVLEDFNSTLPENLRSGGKSVGHEMVPGPFPDTECIGSVTVLNTAPGAADMFDFVNNRSVHAIYDDKGQIFFIYEQDLDGARAAKKDANGVFQYIDPETDRYAVSRAQALNSGNALFRYEHIADIRREMERVAGDQTPSLGVCVQPIVPETAPTLSI